MDKSSFLHHGSGIPHEVAFFIKLNFDNQTDLRRVTLAYCRRTYDAHFELDTHNRFRLFWKSDFSRLIQSSFLEVYTAFFQDKEISGNVPLMRLEKLSEKKYSVEFIKLNQIEKDVEAEIIEESLPRTEGRSRKSYGKRYERDPRNRRDAIAYHGVRCKVCGFDFGEVYGEPGAGYTEVHHVVPLSSTDEEQVVDPKKDLVPVCVNCHSIIHRKSDDVLSIEEVKEVLNLSGLTPRK